MIKITVNNIVIPVVNSTIEIKKQNNSFSSSFNISKTTKNFVVLETNATVEALGDSSLFSTNTNVFTNVLVQDGHETFNGILTVRDIIEGGRKCDVVYVNALIPHLTNKIHTYFTNVTVDGSTEQEYAEESDTDFTDTAWQGFVESKISRAFPEVYYNFPSIPYPTKFGSDIQPEDEWYGYQGEINQKNIGIVSLNTYDVSDTEYLSNKNVITPFYYLQAPLYMIFKDTFGYHLTGTFVEDEVQQQRLFFSENDNLVAVTINEKTVYKQHLTIHPERFLPDDTVSEYLNKLTNHYNLKLDINHATKTISLNYNEEAHFNAVPLDISNFTITNHNLPTYSTIGSFILTDTSETDYVKVYADSTELSNVEDDDTTVIKTSFKAVPSVITQDWEELSGTGVLNYNYKENAVYHLDSLLNSSGVYETNYIAGTGGIFKTRWSKWLPFRIKAKTINPKLVCSLKQKTDVEKANSLYLNGQTFLRKEHTFKIDDEKYNIELELLTRR